ncbi:squalene/phytoene synthase family protein [Streptomyces sp. NPDC047017]|uniref:squalene/phytoene synthase family protein n=1 Tax=Streptomyces sp. NPDC047017 TaxID=3155024 RepID=UPI0034049CDF
MTTWSRCLDAAGIAEPELRGDYGAQRRLVSSARRTSYLAARTLLPPALLPHVVVATAVMHQGDDLLDTGPKPRRAAAWAAWEQEIRDGLDTGRSTLPAVRALLRTITAHPRLRGVVETYLSTATAELEFSGFADEAGFQAYVDAYSLPAFLLIGVLLAPPADDGGYRDACRAVIEASQRLDFVNDLAEDVREGRLGVPARTLERHGVTAADIAAGRTPPGLAALVEEQVGAARAALLAARTLPALTTSPYAPLIGAIVETELLTADAALARGPRLVHGSASPPLPGALRVLLRARRKARGHRGA